MKTNNLIRLSAILVILLGLIFTGCNKKPAEQQTSSDSSSLQQLSSDETNMENNSDEALNDANAVLSPEGRFKSMKSLPCHATIDSAPVHNDTINIYIRYHGLTCNTKKSITGTIEIIKDTNTKWYEKGATVFVKFIDFKVTKMESQKSMTFNGTKTFVNESGGFIWQLGNQIQTLVHRVTGAIQVTFDDNTTKTWNIAKRRTLTRVVNGTISQFVLTVDGLATEDGLSYLVLWGTNRNNEEFYTQITQSVTSKEDCGWDPCCGIEFFQIPAAHKSATITYGYDASNNQLPCSGNVCPSEYKVDWTVNSHSGTFYLQLP
jgi:PBP1b-binding outer membrane lipoprotein LpoB